MSIAYDYIKDLSVVVGKREGRKIERLAIQKALAEIDRDSEDLRTEPYVDMTVKVTLVY